MKKPMIFLLAAFLAFGLAGCSFFNSTTPTETIPLTTTNTGTVPTTTATLSVSMDEILSLLYERIYADIYDDVRAEVIADLTEARFQEIYAQVLAEIEQKIADGEITVSAETIADQVLAVAVNSGRSVIGVSNLGATGSVQSVGSGIIYKHTGSTYYVVTNNHVVEGGASYEIQLEDGTKIPALLKGTDELVDLAVLTFSSDADLPVAVFGDSEAVTKGTVVLAVGHPSGYDFFDSVTMGIVSGIDRYFDIDNDNVRDMFVSYLQHDASINAGNSGGALFNLNGEVIGINVIKIAATEIEGMGFAIPINLAAAICSDIEIYGVSKQVPLLGIQLLDIWNVLQSSPSYFTDNGITLPSGVTAGFYVTYVYTGTEEEQYTLENYVQVGDIIVQIGDVVIHDSAQYRAEFGVYHVDDVVDIVIYRNGVRMTLTGITLLPKP